MGGQDPERGATNPDSVSVLIPNADPNPGSGPPPPGRESLLQRLDRAWKQTLGGLQMFGSLASIIAILIFLAERVRGLNGANTREMVWMVLYLLIFSFSGLAALLMGFVFGIGVLSTEEAGPLTKILMGWALVIWITVVGSLVAIGCDAVLHKAIGPLF
jgi:hypothetical protein